MYAVLDYTMYLHICYNMHVRIHVHVYVCTYIRFPTYVRTVYVYLATWNSNLLQCQQAFYCFNFKSWVVDLTNYMLIT